MKGAVSEPSTVVLGVHTLAAQILIHRSMFVEQIDDSFVEYPLVAWHPEISVLL